MENPTVKQTATKSETKGENLTIPLNNFQISYDDIGDGSIPIIFLHGFPFDKTMWQPQVDFLKSTYRLISCDIRGFGKSKDEESSLSIELFADDLIQFMDALNLDKTIICGLSMGGYIALDAVKRYPDRFEVLILCDTQCISDAPDVKEKRYKAIDEIEANGADKFNEAFIEKIFHEDSFSNKKELVEQVRKVVVANSDHILKSGLAAIAERTETCSMLKEIAIPTLILCGREDEVTPLARSESMNIAINESVLHVIDHAGHLSNLEQPEVFNKYLIDFMDSLTTLNFEKVNGSERMT